MLFSFEVVLVLLTTISFLHFVAFDRNVLFSSPASKLLAIGRVQSI